MKFIPDKNLKELENYKYNGGEYTTLDNLCNIGWNWAISFMPTYLHPNMITLMGGCFLISSISFFFLTTSNPFIEACPSVLYLIQ